MEIPNRKGAQHGFSLVELLIVISLFSIMAVSAMPNISSDVSSKDLNNAAATLTQWINRATKIASAESTFVDVKVNKNIIIIEKLNIDAIQTITLSNKIAFQNSLTIRFGSLGNVFTNPPDNPTEGNGERVDSDITLSLVSTTNNTNKIISISPIGRVAS